MTQTRLLLVRHGDSYSRTDGVFAGPRACRGLTELGRSQASALRDRLVAAGLKPDAVYCSPVHRAAQTAAILTEGLGVSAAVTEPGLNTFNLSDELDGLSWERIRAEFTHRGEGGRPDGGVFVPFEVGNESWAELVARVGRTLCTLAARHTGGTVLALMHRESVEASLVALGALPLVRGFEVDVENTSVTEWSTEDDPAQPWRTDVSPVPPVRWTLRRFNDSAHLEDRTRLEG